MRPFDALHLLSYVTRPRYQDDLLDLYAQWGLLRYLGFFDRTKARRDSLPNLKLSDAGRRITGNQRRVTSEEMGIAFGALLACHWFTQTGAADAPISIVDIDAALDDRYVFAGGARRAVRAVGARRPDYLMISLDPSTRLGYRIRTLECKGTNAPRYSVNQLARALNQLDGITVGGRVPAGLATSMITAKSEVSYRAIDPMDEEEPSYTVNSRTMQEAVAFRIGQDRSDLPPTALANATVSASWATLADFGGNLGALQRWAPEVMRRRLDRRSRNRETFDTPFGTATGTRVTFTVNGYRLTVDYAIDADVDRQLSQGAADSVIEAQAEFAGRVSRSETMVDHANATELHSATSDGSIFSLTLTQ